MSQTKAAITAVGGYVPDYVLTNKELETIVDTNEEWIVSRTGIKERRILKGEGLGSSFMGEKAVADLISKSDIEATDIECIICATVTPDFMFPTTANLIGGLVGAKNAFGYDMSAACSGFLFALETGAQFVNSGKYKNVVVVGVDKMSSIVNYEDRSTCIIFGDGAGAVLLQPDSDGNGIQDSILRQDAVGKDYLYMKGGGSVRPASEETVKNKEHYLVQEGATVFKYAVSRMADVSAELMEKNNLTSDDVAWLVPHQANKRIIDATAKRAGLSDDKVMLNIDKYGNTTAATIPLCLWDYESKLKKGDNLVLAAFGGGFTWGSLYLKWAYDPK